ncbi:MAG: hypothetical protein H7641_04230 [Candidatus Heimdallarchaeota archaeon]|nr:hypothetical protein [Candidatus Heimdallarchaeota archaeon]MCK4876771.1 hypothetical protein [Candidatus Heimdallarchaeota archaeon]
MSENSTPPKPPYPVKKKENKEKAIEERKEIDEYPPKPQPPAPSPSESPSIPVPVPVSEELPGKEVEDTDVPKPIEYSHVSYEEQRRSPITSEDLASEEVEGPKKWSFFWWGCLFFFLWNILLMFILEPALHPRDSFSAGIIAYSLGLFGLVVFALLVRSKKKFALAFPILLLIIFGLSILFHFINAPIYSPLAPLGERAKFVTESIRNSTNFFDPETPLFGLVTIETLELWSLAVFVADFIFALIIGFVGCLSLIWIVDLFSSVIKFSTSFLIFLALVLFTIGLVISPIIHLGLAGFVDFGGNTLLGANQIWGGVDIMRNFDNATQEEINTVLEDFLLAAENFRSAHQSLSMFSFAYGFITITSALIQYLGASVILLNGIEPMINGSYQVFQGFKDVANALNYSSSALLAQGVKKQTQIDDDLFNIGVNKVEEGLNELSTSIDLLDTAFTEIETVNMTDIINSLESLPIPAGIIESYISPYIFSVEEYVVSFADLPAVLEILVEKPIDNGDPSRFTTLTHFLYGAYNLIKAIEIIDDTSAYNGTSALLDNALSNSTLVIDQLAKDEIQQMIGADTVFFSETLNFLFDINLLVTDISYYGLNIGSVFEGLNSTLIYFEQGYENITNYPEIQTDLGILVTDAENLNNTAYAIEGNITSISSKSENEEYGVFTVPSQEILSSLERFDFIIAVENSVNVAKALFHLFNGMSHLKDTNNHIKTGSQLFNVSLYNDANNSFIAANVSLTNSITEMDLAISYMTLAEGEMQQLDESKIALETIKSTLVSTIVYFNNLLALALLGPAANPLDVAGNSTAIVDALATVNDDLNDVKAQ